VTQADELADQLQAGIDESNTELAAITDQSWSTVVTSAEGWTVGHTAHHIAGGYGQSRCGVPVVIDNASMTVRTTLNTRCLEAHGSEPPRGHTGDAPRAWAAPGTEGATATAVCSTRCLFEGTRRAPARLVPGYSQSTF
jgi:hypothetical protein